MSFGRRILKGIKSRSLWNHCLLLGLVLIDLKILAIYEISLSALMLFWEQSQSPGQLLRVASACHQHEINRLCLPSIAGESVVPCPVLGSQQHPVLVPLEIQIPASSSSSTSQKPFLIPIPGRPILSTVIYARIH